MDRSYLSYWLILRLMNVSSDFINKFLYKQRYMCDVGTSYS